MPRYHGRSLRKGRYSRPGYAYLITAVTYEREPLFSVFETARLLVRHMRTLHESRYVDSMAWVVMPDHLHWLFQLRETSLGEVAKRLKSASAVKINKHLGREGRRVWQKGYHDHTLRSDEDMRRAARYIVANPLRAGLVKRIGDYPWWDAVWL